MVRQRQPRVECPAFLEFVRTKPCCACNRHPPSQAAHLRMGNLEIGKRPTGIGEKPSDRWANPLCADCHLDAPDAQHNVGEVAFWARVGVDPFQNAMALYGEFEAGRPGASDKPARKSRPKPRRQPANRPKAKIPQRANHRWPSRPIGPRKPHK